MSQDAPLPPDETTCPSCGERILAAAKKCKHCGEWIASQPNPILAQQVNAKAIKLQPIFALIEKAGGPKLPKMSSLSFSERSAVTYSMWAWFFTIFYYIYHGMWKKGVTLFLIFVPIIVLVEMFIPALPPLITSLAVSGLFAVRAKLDLYKHYVLHDTSWI